MSRLEISQNLNLSQRLFITPSFQMSLKLLQMHRQDLIKTIWEHLKENPALEEIQETASLEEIAEQKKSESKIKEVKISENFSDNPDWENYLAEYNSTGRNHFTNQENTKYDFESFTSRPRSLQEHILWQLLMTHPSADEKKIGSVIAANLDEKGYLDVSLSDVVKISGIHFRKAKQVLDLMQSFDPAGVCTRNLKECLMIQTKRLGLDGTILTDIIYKHLDDVESEKYRKISYSLRTYIDEVFEAVEIIKNMEPIPARQFYNEPPQYIIPDIFVYEYGDEYQILLNEERIPGLRIGDFYQRFLKKKGGQFLKTADNTGRYAYEKTQSALQLILSIDYRQKTIYKIMSAILDIQKDFFTKGVSYLKPMTLKDVAYNIEAHESTVSRAATNKFVQTPQGVFELKFFFNSSIDSSAGDSVSSISVQHKIKKIVETEDPLYPVSDRKIAEILKSEGINVARRTVAKYRDIINISSSADRRKNAGIYLNSP